VSHPAHDHEGLFNSPGLLKAVGQPEPQIRRPEHRRAAALRGGAAARCEVSGWSTASSTGSEGDFEGLKGTAVSKEISNILISKNPLAGQKPSNGQTQHC
jgi:hypothetical protein